MSGHRRGAWALSVLAIVTVAAAVLVGRMGAMQFASLAVSVLTSSAVPPRR